MKYKLMAGDPSRFEMAITATRDAALAAGASEADAEVAVMRERHAHYQCGRRSAVIANHHATGRFYVRAAKDGVEDGEVLADADLDGTFGAAVLWGLLWSHEDQACRALYISAHSLALHQGMVATLLAHSQRGAA